MQLSREEEYVIFGRHFVPAKTFTYQTQDSYNTTHFSGLAFHAGAAMPHRYYQIKKSLKCFDICYKFFF